MRFLLKGVCKKKVWWNDNISLFEVEERYQDKTKTWKVFCKHQLLEGCEYEMKGFVNMGVSKKYKDDKGYFATDYSFQCNEFKEMNAEEKLFGNDQSTEGYF
jgi:hypothetical protein